MPADVSLVTLGDSMLTEFARPPITAVSFSVVDQCCRAVELLLGMMSGQQPACCAHLIPVHLTARGSTGRPAPAWGAESHAAGGEGGR